jgi:quercetin dioxygenase-like cupin family protein
MTITSLVHLGPHDGKTLQIGRFEFTFKAGAQCQSGYTVAEVVVPPGAVNGPHRHPCEETMYLLAGELEFAGESGERRRVPAGATVHVPADTVHYYTNATAEPARLLVVAPVAQEAVFDDLARASGDPARVAAAMARHGVVAAKARVS